MIRLIEPRGNCRLEDFDNDRADFYTLGLHCVARLRQVISCWKGELKVTIISPGIIIGAAVTGTRSAAVQCSSIDRSRRPPINQPCQK